MSALEPTRAEAGTVSTTPLQGQGAYLPVSAVLQLTLINLFWSASTVAAKSCLDVFGPLSLTFFRFLPASLFMVVLARSRRHWTEVKRQDWPAFIALGGIGIALTYSLFYLGVKHTTATDSSLLFACEPILIALFARIFLKEQLRRSQWSGLCIGLFGIALIAGNALGNLIALVALCCETSVSVLAKRLSHTYSGLMVVSIEMLIGSVFVLPGAMMEMIYHPPMITWAAFAGLVYLCLICSFVCYGVWYGMLGRYPVSLMASFILVQPLCGPINAWLLRGERPGSACIAGGLCVVFGILLTSRKT